MAIALEELYAEIEPNYTVKLRTKSCFQKIIEWMHVVEEIEFVKLLHGNELVFNSGLQYASTEWIIKFIDELNKVGAGGLIISLHEKQDFPPEVIDHANQLRFPLFQARWDTPYVDITRLFASVLLKNEQKETNLITALKNAIYFSANEDAYLNHFESNGFYRNMHYTMAIISCHTYRTQKGNPKLKLLEKQLAYSPYRTIVYEEQDMLFALIADEKLASIQKAFEDLGQRDPNIYIGIGTRAHRLQDIHESFEHALSAYQLTKTAIDTNVLSYDKLGIYQILSNMKEPNIGNRFVKETIGKLIAYDTNNQTDYLHILEVFFENECSILHASQALYCHKNTLTYKLNKIREILGYDILLNENRTKIMISFYLMRVKK